MPDAGRVLHQAALGKTAVAQGPDRPVIADNRDAANKGGMGEAGQIHSGVWGPVAPGLEFFGRDCDAVFGVDERQVGVQPGPDVALDMA